MGSEGEASPFVRPYAVTGGRTQSHSQLAMEALVTTTARGWNVMHTLVPEYEKVCRLCSEFKSVAEIAALLKMPLGVTGVIVGDLAESGLVSVQQPDSPDGQPDLALLERVLIGLRNL
ncbi:MAG TPA: DUF742 domain-containing protein [Actinocrinis sp.]|nr:DUF742 domain-containing protein [Actinocrinis sp.]